MITRVDFNGHVTMMLESVLGHNKYSAACGADDKCFWQKKTQSVQVCKRLETQSIWAGSTVSIVLLKDLKEINPIDIAEFTKSRGAFREPTFFWHWFLY